MNSNILEKFFEGNSLPMAITNLKLEIIWANTSALKMLEFSLEELTKLTIADLTPTGKASVDLERYKGLLKGDIDNYTIMKPYLKKDGSLIDGAITVSKIEVEDEIYISGIFHKEMRSSEKQSIADTNSMDFLTDLLSLNPDFHYFVNMNTKKYLYENKKLLNYLGYKLEQIPKNKSEYDFLSEKIEPESIIYFHERGKKFKERSKRKEFTDVEYKIFDAEGKGVWLRERAVPIYNDQTTGDLISYGIIQDITEKVIVYQELKENEKFIAQVAETTPDIIYVVDIEKADILYANISGGDFLGYTLKEYSSLRSKIIHPDQRERFETMINNIVKSEKDDIVSDEFICKTKKGDYIWTMNKFKVFKRNDSGQPTQFLSIVSDINAYKNSITSLKNSENTKTAILNAIPDLIMKVNKEFVYIDVVPHQFDYGYNINKDIIGKHISEVLDDGNLKLVSEKLKKTFAKKELIQFDMSRTISNQTYYLENHISYINEDEVIIVVRDITERKELELSLDEKINELYLKNTELEQYLEKNIELERFAYIVSHDLKEPLRTVKSFSQIVNNKFKSQFTDESLVFLRHINSGISRMEELIDGILNFSRIDSRGNVFTEVDLNDVLEKVLRDLEATINKQNSTINIAQLPMVKCDEIQMRQLLQNLISNAIKFKKDKTVEIEITAVKKEPNWLFEVKDNGIGIRKAQHHNIFSIFRKLHGKETYPGQGIGLSICKKIIERHDGEIWVESTPNEGSSFFFTLPIE